MVLAHTNGRAMLTAGMAVFSAALLTACSSDPQDQSSSEQINPYHNGYIVTQIVTTYYSGATSDIETIDLTFDADRRVILLSENSADPELTFSFDENGLIINSTDEGDTVPDTIYQYDSSNRLVGISKDESSIMSRRYPAATPVAIGPLDPRLFPERIQEISTNGDIDELNVVYQDGVSGTATFSPSQNTTRITLTEAAESMLVLEITTDASDDVEVRIEYDYDANDNLVAIREFDRDGTLDTEVAIEYATAAAGLTNPSALFFSPFDDTLRFNIDSITASNQPVLGI